MKKILCHLKRFITSVILIFLSESFLPAQEFSAPFLPATVQLDQSVDLRHEATPRPTLARLPTGATTVGDNSADAGLRAAVFGGAPHSAEGTHHYAVAAVDTVKHKSDSSRTARDRMVAGVHGFPIVLNGNNLPEQATVGFSVIKPANAAGNASLTLMVFDADNLDEGKLEINGAGPIQLFGRQASAKNDRHVIPITLTTSVDWWNDGRNTLRFVHTRVDGFRIDSVSVKFETIPSRFPIVLQGNNLLEQATANLIVDKPLNAFASVALTLMVFDADNLDEGTLEINGAGPIQLFGRQASAKNDRQVVPITLTTSVDWWNDGRNTLRFVHTRTDGYRIESASVKFEAPLYLAQKKNRPPILTYTANPTNGITPPTTNFGGPASDSYGTIINDTRISWEKEVSKDTSLTHIIEGPGEYSSNAVVEDDSGARVSSSVDEAILTDAWASWDGEIPTDSNPTQIVERPAEYTASVVFENDKDAPVGSGVDVEVNDDYDTRVTAAIQVGKWRRHVIILSNSTYSGNPFELEVDGIFTHTNSRTEIRVPGFYSGGDAWSVAFMPTLIGKWTYKTTSADSNLDGVQGLIDCFDSGHPGILKADTEHARKWKYTDGPYVVPIGLLLDIFLEPGDHAEFTRVADFLKNEVGGHLLHFRLTDLVFAGDWRDHEFDLALWDRLDERMEILTERGLGVEIMLYTDGAGKPKWEGQTDTERLLIRYMVARLGAYPVVKFNTGIDVREFRDQAWVDWYGTQVQSLDPYDHPVSSRYGGGSGNLVMATQSFDSRQTKTAKINELTNLFETSSVPVSADSNWGKNGSSQAIYSSSDIRRALWKAVMAGGVAIHVCNQTSSSYSDTDDPDRWFHAEDIATALESEQWLGLVNPFIQTKLGDTFGAMVPENLLVTHGFALADPSRTKILCFLMGVNDTHDKRSWGALKVRLPGTETEYSSNWFDPRTGKEIFIGNFRGGDYVFSPPSSDDWVLLLEQSGSSTFPVILQGQDLPREATINLDVYKPLNATASAALTLMLFDAGTTDEGTLEINGNNYIQLFCDQASFGNPGRTVPFTLTTPSNWWNNGINTLRIFQTGTGGYRIDNAIVDFEISIFSGENLMTSSATSEVSKFANAPASRTIYEDAEDGSTTGWFRYNSGVVKNIKGGANGSMRAIEIDGDREHDVFHLGKENGSAWNNSKELFVEFSVAFDEFNSGVIYFQLATSKGVKYLVYTNGEITQKKDSGMIYFNLGDLAGGKWYTIQRNLQKDLEAKHHDTQIKTVDGLFVYGSLRLDNIHLLRYE